MKQPTPSYSYTLAFANENPINAHENNMISRSFDSLSDLILALYNSFGVKNDGKNDGSCMASSENFEMLKEVILQEAQRGKNHFAFKIKITNLEDGEQCDVDMLRPMTTKSFPQDMFDGMMLFYKGNPSVVLGDKFRGAMDDVIMLLTKELAFVHTMVNDNGFITDYIRKQGIEPTEFCDGIEIETTNGWFKGFKPTKENR